MTRQAEKHIIFDINDNQPELKGKKQMTVDYKFCRKSKLTAKDLFIWLELDDLLDKSSDELYSWNFFGRNMMFIGSDLMIVRISCKHKDFDRWSNSEEMTFDLNRRSEKRAFIDWIIEQREAKN